MTSRVALLLTLLLFTASVFFTASSGQPDVRIESSLATPTISDAASKAVSTIGDGGSRDDSDLELDSLDQELVDRCGNEVSNAVGDYRIDQQGDLYERHAPDVAVEKLGPPGT